MGKKFLAGFKLFLSTVLVFFLLCSVVVADPLYAKDGCVPFLGAEKTFREIRAKFVDGELKEFPQIPDSLKVFLGLKAESVTLQSCFAPPYFNIWPLPSHAINPEDQYYFYHRATDMICIAVASVNPVFPGSAITVSEIPCHQGVTCSGFGVTTPNEYLRQRIFSDLESPTHTFGVRVWGKIKQGDRFNPGPIYLYMGNSGSPHVGYVHFFPLWKLSSLTSYPSGTFMAQYSTVFIPTQQVRFDPEKGFRLIEWVYVQP